MTVTLAGSGARGGKGGGGLGASFDQPGGLTLSNSRILIADRENHQIRQVSAAEQSPQPASRYITVTLPSRARSPRRSLALTAV